MHWLALVLVMQGNTKSEYNMYMIYIRVVPSLVEDLVIFSVMKPLRSYPGRARVQFFYIINSTSR